jgi:hypothetical protein
MPRFLSSHGVPTVVVANLPCLKLSVILRSSMVALFKLLRQLAALGEIKLVYRSVHYLQCWFRK